MNVKQIPLLKIFLIAATVGPGFSTLLYVFFPEQTIKSFNGAISPTATVWCRATSSADAIVAVNNSLRKNFLNFLVPVLQGYFRERVRYLYVFLY
jgi:hypothetical protein